MEKEKITIIVPFHSIEAYLEKCLTSIQNQTYKNFEVIMLANNVHDGSIGIAKKFANADDRFVLKKYPFPGKNIAKIRNYALSFASGEYVSWVDGDDYVSPNFLKVQYEAIKDNNADLSICRHWPTKSRDHKFSKKTKCKTIVMTNTDGQIGILTRAFINGSTTNKMYRTSLLKTIPLNEKCTMFEDLEYNFRYLSNCSKIVYNKKYLYAVYHRPDSLSREPNKLQLLRRLTTMNEVVKQDQVTSYALFARGLHIAIVTPLLKKCKASHLDLQYKILFARYLKEARDSFKNIKLPFYKKLYVWIYYMKYKKYLKKNFLF